MALKTSLNEANNVLTIILRDGTLVMVLSGRNTLMALSALTDIF